jgi:hypothetical protein
VPLSRVEQELQPLRTWFGEALEYFPDGHWLRLSEYRIPSDLWVPDVVEVCFQLPPGLPGQAPYAFHVRPQVRLVGGGTVNNYTYPTANPLGDGWGTFSWQLADWRPGADPYSGTSMLDFARSIADRFREGA